MGFMLLGAVLLALVVWFAYRASRWAAARSEVDAVIAEPSVRTLDYAVPEGQDPAVVVAALRENGLEAAPDVGAKQLVHVACAATSDADRERVRSIIEAVRTSSIDAGAPFEPGVVRFEDER